MGWRLTGLAVAGVAALTLAGSASGRRRAATRAARAGRCRPELGCTADRRRRRRGRHGPGRRLVPSGGSAHARRASRGDPRARKAARRASRSCPFRHHARARRAARRRCGAAALGAHDPARCARTPGSSRSTCSAPRRSRGSSGSGSTTPTGSEHLERAPKMAASRAEAAYSLSKLLTLEAWKVSSIRAARGRVRRAHALRLATLGPREGASLRRLPVRLLGDVGEDAEALERRGAGRHDHGAGRLRLLGPRLAGLQARAVRCAPLFSRVSSRAGRRTR